MKEYFYRDHACKAKSANDIDCICWHPKGTGPLSEEEDRYLTWRDSNDRIAALTVQLAAETARADAAVASLAAAKGYMSKAALKRFMRSTDVRNAVYPPEQTP